MFKVKKPVARLGLGTLTIALMGLVLTGMPMTVEAQDLSYAAKVVCKVRPNDGQFVTRGEYASVVNIHNPHDFEVMFIKKAVRAVLQRQDQQSAISPWVQEILLPDEALAVDCNDIAQLYTPPSGGFFDGFVVVRVPPSPFTNAPPELDVWVYYSAKQQDPAGGLTDVSSIDVEEVHPKLIGDAPAEARDKSDTNSNE